MSLSVQRVNDISGEIPIIFQHEPKYSKFL